jgi:hypothetical protein
MKAGDLILFRPRCSFLPRVTYFTHVSVCINSSQCLEIHRAGHGIPRGQSNDDRPRVYTIQERVDTARDLGWSVYWSPSYNASSVELAPGIQNVLRHLSYNYMYWVTEILTRLEYLLCPARVLEKHPRRKQTCATFAVLILSYYLNLMDPSTCHTKKLLRAATPDEVYRAGPYDRIFFII